MNKSLHKIYGSMSKSYLENCETGGKNGDKRISDFLIKLTKHFTISPITSAENTNI